MSTVAAPTVAGRVLRRRYLDSVVLMRLAQQLAALPGVTDAAALMGTEANKAMLAAGGFDGEALSGASGDDVVICVKAADGDSAATALGRIDTLLAATTTTPAAGSRRAATLEEALAVQPASNLAVVSVPGDHAAAVARRALELGLHAFVFSSNVALDDEIALKRLAEERGLLCMGPDCGTAIIAGRGVGFANAVSPGPVGVVGASGTGIQAVTSLLDQWGTGVSHALGAGSRDASDAVGGATLLAGLAALDADPGTRVIVLVSKPPGPRTAAALRAAARASATPVVVCFLGAAESDEPVTLDDAARRAAALAGAAPPEGAAITDAEVAALRGRLSPQQRWIRGLYAGGTLGYEAQIVLAGRGVRVGSNGPLPGTPRLADAARSEGHTVIDLGAEEFTRGRPHPMIDARVRRSRLLAEADDPAVAVILFDVVLGYGAAADPAGDLAGALGEAQARAAARGDRLVFVASVCGTAADPQGFAAQVETLRRAGVHVAGTNADAAALAARVVTGGPR